MRTEKQMQVFESVMRGNPLYRGILQADLDAKTTLLVAAVDGEQMRRLQGQAQALQNLIKDLDESLRPRGRQPTA